MFESSRLRSRKFWLTVATFVSGVLVTLFDVEVDPEVVYGILGTVATYLGMQGLIDRDMQRVQASLASLGLAQAVQFGESLNTEFGSIGHEATSESEGDH